MYRLAIILNNIRSTHNVGSILRTADGFGVTKVYFSGYTPYPQIKNDPRLPHESQKLTNAISKTALGAEKTVAFTVHATCQDAIVAARNDGYHIIALEQDAKSTPLPNYCAKTDIAVILGNEVSGVEPDVLTLVDDILEIPMNGKKESFNVSVSLAVCLYALKNQCK